MSLRDSYPPGTFCWVDLATGDPETAKPFYADLFGWRWLEIPGGDGVYHLATLDERPVAGARRLGGDDGDGPVPAHWMSYVSVTDVDAAAGKAVGLGGQLLSGPFDALAAGRLAMVQDPTGARVCLWQPGTHHGAGLVNQHGALCWNELLTGDTDAAATFYGELFGWQTEPFGDSYTIFLNGDRGNGGMLRIEPEQTEPVPPNWTAYFAIDDCDAAHERAQALGGSVRMPPTDFPEVGRGCVLADPQGSVFAVIQLANPPD